jgi:predicted 3-demethylubiquinone-9 3-methyltransferase (glyoxalase superfamily)
MPAKNTICLWYDGTAEEAARFYAETFPDSRVTAVHKAPGDYPDGKEGGVLTVEFTVLGIPCLGLNGGPHFKHSEAFSFQVSTADHGQDRHRGDREGAPGLTARSPLRRARSGAARRVRTRSPRPCRCR